MRGINSTEPRKFRFFYLKNADSTLPGRFVFVIRSEMIRASDPFGMLIANY